MKIIKEDKSNELTVANLLLGEIFVYWSANKEVWSSTVYMVVIAKNDTRDSIMPKQSDGIIVLDLGSYELTWLSNYHKVKIYKDSELHLK